MLDSDGHGAKQGADGHSSAVIKGFETLFRRSWGMPRQDLRVVYRHGSLRYVTVMMGCHREKRQGRDSCEKVATSTVDGWILRILGGVLRQVSKLESEDEAPGQTYDGACQGRHPRETREALCRCHHPRQGNRRGQSRGGR